ncbi:hypothetical protein [Cytobacillus firmus]|uniref:hypothetical protein n=1 Tax=Cytobacillus firmus TaxID=1399 RepID=UPI0018CCD114|nr:hypothetical protein [Cytobacillus firmus]MBG9548385.1 hypothetical protein [Cytobacillus firmus]MBG9548464.1 hypothetical protein [Cytobacillus firmus]MBG9548493.1 hypothetical protein [Cytobacillus firmus]MBG9548506.1 hypothetical protein [Cytobacillus firmus]MBG9602817.1 hypothetical protein [Cytobacillus firmus]
MKILATLDERNICIGILETSEIITGAIELQEYDRSLLGKKYEDGAFVDVPPQEVVPQTTLEDKINYIYYKQMGAI